MRSRPNYNETPTAIGGLTSTLAESAIELPIRLLDGTRAYLHAVIENYSRRILAWRAAGASTAASSVAVPVEASRHATPSETVPVVLADADVENVNAPIDALIATGVCGACCRSQSSRTPTR